MTIYLGSRYENSVVDFVATGGDDTAAPVVFYSFADIGRISYSEYIWRYGDRLDQIAWKFYRQPESWWLIAYYNPQIKDFFNIPEGTVVKIANV
jgi:hypothetical protein